MLDIFNVDDPWDDYWEDILWYISICRLENFRNTLNSWSF